MGVLPHETALSYFDLGDFYPAKIHITVPVGFRRNDRTPKAIVLHRAAEIHLDDGIKFRIGDTTLDIDVAPYGGSRFPMEVLMAGRRFAQFHLDVSCV